MGKLSALKKFLWLGLFFVMLKLYLVAAYVAPGPGAARPFIQSSVFRVNHPGSRFH